MARVPIESLNTGVIQEGITQEPVFINQHDSETGKEISWVIGNDEREDPNEPLEPAEEADKTESSESEESESDEDEEKPRKKKNKVTAQRRIADLTRKLKEAQSFAYDILNQKEHLEKRLSSKEKESMAYHEKLLATNKEQIKAAMTKAHEEGDSETHAHAADLLSQYNNELMMIQSRKQAGYQERYQTQRIPDEIFDVAEDPLDEEQHESGMRWIERNPWANPNSRSFDNELAHEADQYTLKLAKKYKLQGREDDIGTDDFWEDITDYMAEAYEVPRGRQQSDHPQKRQTMTMRTPSGSQVATPSRRPMESSYRQAQKDFTLTQDQKDFARSMRGFVKDAKGNKIMDNKGLEEAYKRNLMRGNS